MCAINLRGEIAFDQMSLADPRISLQLPSSTSSHDAWMSTDVLPAGSDISSALVTSLPDIVDDLSLFSSSPGPLAPSPSLDIPANAAPSTSAEDVVQPSQSAESSQPIIAPAPTFAQHQPAMNAPQRFAYFDLAGQRKSSAFMNATTIVWVTSIVTQQISGTVTLTKSRS